MGSKISKPNRFRGVRILTNWSKMEVKIKKIKKSLEVERLCAMQL